MYLMAILHEITTCDGVLALFEADVTMYGSLTRASRHEVSPRYTRDRLVHMDVRASNATTTSQYRRNSMKRVSFYIRVRMLGPLFSI